MFTGTLSINQGDFYSGNFNAIDINGSGINLAGKSGAGYIKLKYGDSGILDQFNFSIIDSGNFAISLNPNHTAAYPVTQGVYGVYVFNTTLNANPYQAQVARGYINIYPELISNFTGLFTGVSPSPDIDPQSYFGFSSLTISGSITYNDELGAGQGVKTTRIDVQAPGASYISYIVIGNNNAFEGATLNYIITMPASPSPALYFETDQGILIQQPALPNGGSVFIQFGFDGTHWQINQWA